MKQSSSKHEIKLLHHYIEEPVAPQNESKKSAHTQTAPFQTAPPQNESKKSTLTDPTNSLKCMTRELSLCAVPP